MAPTEVHTATHTAHKLHSPSTSTHQQQQQQQQCAKFQYVVTASGPKIVPVSANAQQESKDEESAADYNSGGYLAVKVHDTFKNGRYVVQRKLGWGHFSTVWLIKDEERSKHSALKVVKSASRYAETARDEIKLLRKVMAANPSHSGRDYVVSFLDSFQHQGPEEAHVCIVFEPLGENLLAMIERNKAKGVPRSVVKTIARQMLLGLQYLHDECDLVHTDIKPENIMISIPDVETLIAAELSASPSPTSRKVGIPPGKSRAASVVIPRKTRDRHVQIFDSQPLPSPTSSSSRSSSPSKHRGLRMSQITSPVSTASSFAAPNASGLVGSAPNSVAESVTTSVVSSVTSTVASMSIDSSTPPTSLGSIISKLDSPADADGKDRLTIPSNLFITPKETPVPKQNVGPSLLAQTAPANIREGLEISSDSGSSVERSLSPPPAYSLSLSPPLQIKIADLGNATPSRIHYTEDIQTRQYRAPEAILGRSDWDHTADIWSAACVIFELLTAEYLFDPQSQGALFSKDDDHMAQVIELLGDFALDAKMGGRYSREIFDSQGNLRYIKSLKPWPLKRVMKEKYLFTDKDAAAVCDFLEPMLRVDFRARARASDMIDHDWLDSVDEANDHECL